ncbi:HAD-IA family hydrolase [Candidatus Uhrbacteria bacterium]|nr:HAD-IA family hydrolase [Candidatus Uhrbacteria bacterium]
MKPKVLLFDFDGTIADTVFEVLQIYNRIAKDEGLRPISPAEFEKMRQMNASEVPAFLHVSILKLPFIVKRVRNELKKQIAYARPIQGVPEAIRSLKKKGNELYIISTNSVPNINTFLTKNTIHDFDGVFSVSDIFGKHRKILRLIKTHEWDPADVVYIGDEARDIDAAKHAKIASAAVTWGFNSEALLMAHHPDRLVRAPSELPLL